MDDRTVISVYIGGGTPTLYPPEAILNILSLIRRSFHLAADAEITLEAHPATLNPENLAQYHQGGIDRLSIGVQSFFDDDLKRLGRHHTANETRAAFSAAREAGFRNISLDLIYGLPGQTQTRWEENLHAATVLHPEHLSLYGLSIEEGTLFHKISDDLRLPSEEEQIIQYQTAGQRLSRAGYQQYEISNFARPDYACRHNLLYWNRGEVLGLGLAAHSYLDLTHWANPDALHVYIDQLQAGHLRIEGIEKISPAQARIEQICFGLRKTEGIPDDLYHAGADITAQADLLIRDGLLIRDQGRARLTPRGMLLVDEVVFTFA